MYLIYNYTLTNKQSSINLKHQSFTSNKTSLQTSRLQNYTLIPKTDRSLKPKKSQQLAIQNVKQQNLELFSQYQKASKFHQDRFNHTILMQNNQNNLSRNLINKVEVKHSSFLDYLENEGLNAQRRKKNQNVKEQDYNGMHDLDQIQFYLQIGFNVKFQINKYKDHLQFSDQNYSTLLNQITAQNQLQQRINADVFPEISPVTGINIKNILDKQKQLRKQQKLMQQNSFLTQETNKLKLNQSPQSNKKTNQQAFLTGVESRLQNSFRQSDSHSRSSSTSNKTEDLMQSEKSKHSVQISSDDEDDIPTSQAFSPNNEESLSPKIHVVI